MTDSFASYMGSCRPLFMTPRTPGRLTLGPRMAQIAALLGRPFMPWQRMAADVSLEVIPGDGPNGWVPAYDTVIVVAERQQGKTELLLPLMTHRATGFGVEQRAVFTRQTGDEARKLFAEKLVPTLEGSALKPLVHITRRAQRERVLFTNGSSIQPVAITTKTGGTGDTIDLGVIDEMWSFTDDRAEIGMRPAMLTRPLAQLWAMSMVPGPTRAKHIDSAYMRSQMRMGRASVSAGANRGVCYIEFGADEDLDPADPATWLSCMPAVCPNPPCRCDPNREWKHTTTIEKIQTFFNRMTLGDFTAEFLSWWPLEHIPTWVTVKERTWTLLRDVTSSARGSVSLAIDCNQERTHAFMAVAGRRFDDDYHVEIVEPGHKIPLGTQGLEWCKQAVLDFVDRNDPLAVVIDPKSAAAALIPILRREDVDVMTPNSQQIAGACARFFDFTGQEAQPEYDEETGAYVRQTRVRHIGQPELTRAVAGARKLTSPTDGTFRWHRVGSSANISPLYAVTLALHGYEVNEDADYDPLDSVA